MNDAHDLSFRNWLSPLLSRVLDGGTPTRDEALRLLQVDGPDCFELFAAANRLRHAFHGDQAQQPGAATVLQAFELPKGTRITVNGKALADLKTIEVDGRSATVIPLALTVTL